MSEKNEYLNNKKFEEIIQRFQTYKKYKSRCELIINDYQESVERKKVKGKKYDEGKLIDCKTQYLDVLREFDESQNQLASAFSTLSKNIIQCFKFYNVEPDDAIQEGVFICFEKIDRFDPAKGRAFNYMTTCVLNHFRQLWRSARNYNELKKKYHFFLQVTKGQELVHNQGQQRKGKKERD